MNYFAAILRRDIKMDFRHGGQFLFLPAFFLLIVTLFPLGLGADPEPLRKTAPGLLMIAALLASLLPLEKLYADDLKDGTIDLLLLSPQPLSLYVAAKTLAHWMVAGLPLVIVVPALAAMLGLAIPPTHILAVFVPATILFVLVGQIAAALILNARRGSVLLALLAVPLYIPVLIFGSGALDLMQAGLPAKGPALFLWAGLAFALPVTPLVTAKLLRMQMD
ncbi:MAG TPA: heme exporter protein CcmB [Rhodospirillaceae bacterium]|nr:heme exporter protein CcmB [Rhodospirillaceae bacterium]